MTKVYGENLPILLVDDEPMLLRGVTVALNRVGMEHVLAVEDPRKVLPLLEETPVAGIVLDLQMPFLTGNELLPVIRQRYPNIPIIILTANTDLESAVSCMKLGAFDYLVKPVDPEKLIVTLQRALEMGELRTEVASLRTHMLHDGGDLSGPFSRFITVNDGMRNILRYAQAIATTRVPVMLCGEPGVGKGPLAKLIHEASGRPGNYVHVNVRGMTDDDFRGEVFGFKQGAVAQAGDVSRDNLPAATEGTIYLEGVEALDLESQERIRELIQEGTYAPLGATNRLRSNVRVIVGSRCAEPEREIQKGGLLDSLYESLREHLIMIPPLRDRVEDIPILLGSFLDAACKQMSLDKPPIPGETLVKFLQYSYPGNVSELEVMVKDAVHGAAAGGTLIDVLAREIGNKGGDAEHSYDDTERAVFREVSGATSALIDFFGHFPTMDEATDFLIDESLKVTRGNKKAAAALLHITRQTINRRLRLRS